ncbi:MAG TPA: TlpA disulfide reductase family protein [Candidatus Eremiobacteraceae bacterium]|nr:TlpA disulfide reductase family protein [Candidatus Eremiobacteraceae bacterium]
MNATSPAVRAAIWAFVILLIGAVIGALIFKHGMATVAAVRSPQSSGKVMVGGALPDLALSSLTGSPVSLRTYTGRPVWVNFFATWCVPCKAELPQIEQRYKDKKAGGLVVFGVDQQEQAVAVKSFTAHFGVTYPIAIDTGAAALAFNIHTIPLSVFVDSSGIVRYISIGQMQPAEMDEALKTILPGG